MGRPKILLVDDQAFILHVYKQGLETEGFEVTCLSNGRDALEYLRSHRPDLVLLDAVMPGMNGFEICRSIRGNPRTAELPVIFLTASAERETVIQAIQSGADDYTLKRSDFQVLLGKINRILSAVGRPDENPDWGSSERRHR